MMPYETNPLTDLTDAELDRLIASESLPPLTSTNMEAIQSRTLAQATAQAPRKRRRHGRGALVAAVLAAAVALVGFTQRDRIAELYYMAFGNPNFAAYAETIGTVSEQDGIRLEVLSALVDQDTTHLLIDVTDISGQNRISSDMSVSSWDAETATSAGLGGGGCSVVAFDEKTGTATLLVSSLGKATNSEIVFSLQSFVTGSHDFEDMETDIDLSALLQNPSPFTAYPDKDGYGGGLSQKAVDDDFDLGSVDSVLESTLNIPLDDAGRVNLTGIALDDDGFLHIQTKLLYDNGMEAFWPSLRNTKTNEDLDSYYSINYGYVYKGIDEVETIGYIEHVFDLRSVDANALQDIALDYSGFYYENHFTGDWKVKFSAPSELEAKTFAANETVTLPDGTKLLVSDVTATPLSITIIGKSEQLLDGFDYTAVSICVLYEDGHSEVVTANSLGTDMNQVTLSFPHYTEDLSQISAIEIAGVTFPAA